MYKKPPITEAVIGISLKESLNSGDLALLQKKLSKNYPSSQSIENVNVKLELQGKPGHRKKANANLDQENGYRLSSVDCSELAIVLPKSITISQLAPYPGWKSFFGRFVRDWNIIKKSIGYHEISRIGVRYINRIDIPSNGPIVEHESFLNVYPNITDEFGPLFGYSLNVEVYIEDMRCTAKINSAAVPSPVLNHSSFVLDQDIIREVQVPQNDKDIFELIEAIGQKKNKIFESCITDKSRALFK